VDDTPTRLLMRFLHDGLAATGDTASALRAAQRSLQELTVADVKALDHPLAELEFTGEAPESRPFMHPFYWAGFSYTARVEPV
jgi:CHAT domain-containing protein